MVDRREAISQAFDLLDASNNEEDAGYTDKFNTALTPDQEIEFQKSMQEQSKLTGRDVLKDLYDYDLRGAFSSGVMASGNGHLPDTYKKPNHPTFSMESQYHTSETPGGQWSQDPDGSYEFTASKHNFKMNPNLQEYWNRVEPGNKLILPSKGSD